MFQKQNQEASSSSSPRQSQSSCESSTERMNRAQTNHQQLNPYQEQPSFKTNNFFIQDYTLEGEEQGSKYKKQPNTQQSQQVQPDRRLKTAVSELVENDDNDQVELGSSSLLKKSSHAPPPVPNTSQIDGKRQIRDITSFFKNNNIFLDEEINIKCTTSQILSRKDELEECLNTSQRRNLHQQQQQQSQSISNDEQSSPLIGRNKEKKEKSPVKSGDKFGRQIMSEYICQEKEVIGSAQNLQIPVIQTAAAQPNANNNGGFQYTNSIYSLGGSESHSSVQTQTNKVPQTLKPNPTNDSLNSFSSIQHSSVENSKGSSNQSIKQLENNVKEEEIKNKIGLESLSILRSEVNQFLGLLQSYNNEIMTSPKHQQLVQQKLQLTEEKSLQQSLVESAEKIKDEIQSVKTKERSSSEKKWKEEYNQKLGEYLDDHKEMSEFCIKQLNDTFNSFQEDKKQSQQQEQNILKNQDKQREQQQDQLIRQKLQMNNEQQQYQQEQKRDYNRRDFNSDQDEGDDADQKSYQMPFVNNYCQNQSSPSSYNEYDDDMNGQSQQLNHSGNSHQQSSYRGSGGQHKKMFCHNNYNNLSIIFSESEKSSPQLKQSTESQHSQQSSSILVDSNKDVIQYDISEKQHSDEQISNSIPNTQTFNNNIQTLHLQNNRNQFAPFSQTAPVQSNGVSQVEINQLSLKEPQNKNQQQKQIHKNGEKNKVFSLDVKNFDGIAEELFKHSDYLQQQINQAQNIAQFSRSTPVDKQRSIMSNDSCNTSINNIDFTKKSDTNESLIYLKEAFSLCMQDLKTQLNADTYFSIEQKFKSVQLEIERTLVLEKKNENLNKSNDMIVQALQATKEEIKQLIQNYHLLSEDHNELIEQNAELASKEKKYLSSMEKIEKERQHLKYLILVANEKFEKIDEKCNHLIKKNSSLNEQISNMQNQFSNINQILREVIINLQENKDSETHHILQQILKETNDMMIKKETESQYSRYSHYSPNASCSAKQSSARENSLGRTQKTQSSSPIREGISPPSKGSTLNHATSSYLNSSLKSKDNNKFMSSQQGVGTIFSNISNNQTATTTAASTTNNKKTTGNNISSNKTHKSSLSQQLQPQQLNQSSGSIKQKENINRQKTPPKIVQKQGMPARSKEDQSKPSRICEMSQPKKVINKERQICEAPELTVYEHTSEMQTSHMCQEEVEINSWLEERNIQMADPLDLIHKYFHFKKKKISEIVAESKKSKGLASGSQLLERRAKKIANAPTITFAENI